MLGPPPASVQPSCVGFFYSTRRPTSESIHCVQPQPDRNVARTNTCQPLRTVVMLSLSLLFARKQPSRRIDDADEQPDENKYADR